MDAMASTPKATARDALVSPPQPELLASQNVGATITKMVVSTPSGPVVKVVAPR